MGGGGGTTVAPVNPDDEIDAQIRLERERARIAEEQAAKQRQIDEQQRAKDLIRFNQQLEQAFTGAIGQGTREIERRGLDADRFTPLIEEQFQQTRQSVPELAASPHSFFNPTLTVDEVVNRALERDRRKLTQQVDQFAGDGFARDLIPNELDDPILNEILSSRFTDAQGQVQRARERGGLSDFGFETALRSLDEQRNAASSRLQGLGSGILESGRESLRNIGDTARQRATEFEFGDSFNPDVFRGQIDTTFDDFSSNLKGKLQDTIGGDPLFNIGDILGRGSVAQGAINVPSASPTLLSAFAKRHEDRNQRRGIGNQGAF